MFKTNEWKHGKEKVVVEAKSLCSNPETMERYTRFDVLICNSVIEKIVGKFENNEELNSKLKEFILNNKKEEKWANLPNGI